MAVRSLNKLLAFIAFFFSFAMLLIVQNPIIKIFTFVPIALYLLWMLRKVDDLDDSPLRRITDEYTAYFIIAASIAFTVYFLFKSF